MEDEQVEAEIKTRQRCAKCRKYWGLCECSASVQLAQLLGSKLKEQ